MKRVLIVLFIWSSVFRVDSATFCVKSGPELRNALLTASLNGEDDVIKLETGEYLGFDDPAFPFVAEENRNLEISGGWFPFNNINCIFQLGKPLDTVIKPNANFLRLFQISLNTLNFDSEIKISNLSFFDGQTSLNNQAGLLDIDVSNSQATIFIDRVMFNNGSSTFGPVIKISGGQLTTIRNSIFTGNQSNSTQGTIKVALDELSTGLYFINNTLFTELGSGINGLNVVINGTAKAFIANNLFWVDGIHGTQIKFSPDGTYYLYNNSYCTLEGTPDFAEGNFCTEPYPLNSEPWNFIPTENSPLVDAGLPAPANPPQPAPFELGWDYGTQDFSNNIGGRVQKGRIDVGAEESPFEVPIFKDGFDASL